MKPRNKFQSKVLAQSTLLPPITQAQQKWAFKNCIEHLAYRLPKGRTTCMDCGHSWVMDTPATDCTCPQCRARLQVCETLQRKLTQKRYFNLLTTCGEYQVLRMFLLHCAMEKGCKARTYTIEIGQYWWDNNGKQCVIAVQRVLGRYIDTFTFCFPMAVRNDNEAYQYVANSYLYPRQRLIPNLTRNGFSNKCQEIHLTKLITALLTDHRAETLMKAGQYKFLAEYLRRGFDVTPYWKSVKICIRNNYIIADGALWKDYIDMLQRLGKDIHNPKYVCPVDLHQEHDRRQNELRRKREKEEFEKKRQKAREQEKQFRELKGRFFGMCFTDGMIQVRVLESVQEYFDEGEAMHHCVFDNAYYLKENSLVFSATLEGKRIATIEVNLNTLEVMQNRGVCNKHTEYHDQIINLVNANRTLIRQRMKATA